MSKLRWRSSAYVLGWLFVAACPSDEGSSAATGGAAAAKRTNSSSAPNQPASSCATNGALPTPSILCQQCVCKMCEKETLACDRNCWDMLRCMHEKCGANEANLDSCAAGACSAQAAGLAAAKAIAPCAYRSADRGRDTEDKSCLIQCNFGPVPTAR